MKTECPNQLGHFLGEKYHRYAPHLDIKFHPKNARQSLENPLAYQGIFMLKNILNELQSLHFDTLTLSLTRVNWVERWSKVREILFIGLTMWVSFVKDGKM
jgi:hypothetical protein